MAAHVKTIGIQKDVVRRKLKSIIPRIEKNLNGIELRLVLIFTYLKDENIASHLK